MTKVISEVFYFDSNSANGAVNLNPTLNQFSINRNTPLKIPIEAQNVKARVINSSVWNTFYNISTLLENNKLSYVIDATTYNLVIPDGLYEVDTLNQLLYEDQLLNSVVTDPGGAAEVVPISITGNTATQKVNLIINKANTQLDLQALDSVAEVLGFEYDIFPAVPSASTLLIIPGTIVANFSQLEFLFLKTNIINAGITYNGIVANGIIHKHIISANIGSKSTYQPPLIPWVSCNELAGQSITILTFTMLDQELNAIDMVGEIYEFTLQIEYELDPSMRL